MDTKERKTVFFGNIRSPVRRPCRTRSWRPAHRSRGEK